MSTCIEKNTFIKKMYTYKADEINAEICKALIDCKMPIFEIKTMVNNARRVKVWEGMAELTEVMVLNNRITDICRIRDVDIKVEMVEDLDEFDFIFDWEAILEHVE